MTVNLLLIILLNWSPAYAQASSSLPEEKLVEVSELRVVPPLIENALKSKLNTIAANPKYKCAEKCKANMAANFRQLDEQLPTLKAGVKTALANDLKKAFDEASLKLLIKIYESQSFKNLQMALPPVKVEAKRLYPNISQPINLKAITNAEAQKKITKPEGELLKKVVVHPAFVKFNQYVLGYQWTGILDEKRRIYAETIKNPFE